MGDNSSQIIKTACDILIIKDNKILLGKRKNCFGAGDWGIPGGHIEPGEKIVEAAKRELFEETGIANVDLELVTVVDSIRQDDYYINFGFLLENYRGIIELKEPDLCEGWEFIDLDNLPKNIFYPHKIHIETFLKNKLYLY